jgi:NitT/TauT family transport system substrate-binding protein
MGRLTAIIITGVVALGLAACGNEDDSEGGGQAASAPSQSSGPITLSVGVDTVYAPMFLADAEGLFEKQGVDVRLRQFAQGGEGVDAMIAGAVDLAGSGDSTVLGKTRGNIRSLGVFVEDVGNYVKLVTREEIDDPKQIKKMGIVPGSISEFGAARLLEAEGIDEADVELVKAGPPELPALLQRGDIDGFVIWEPWPTNATKMGGKVLQPSRAFGFSYVLMVNATGRLAARAPGPGAQGHGRARRGDPARRAGPAGGGPRDPGGDEDPDRPVAPGGRGAAVRRPRLHRRGRAGLRPHRDFLVERDLVKERPEPRTLMAQGFVPGT